jgi:hypothetical protein
MIFRHVAAVALACFSGVAAAQDMRVVVVTKVTLDDKALESSGLEVVVTKTLRSSGARVVELSAALAAQRAAFSDSIQEGKVPKELSSLNADFASSFQLICSTGPATTLEAMGETSQAHNYPCELNEKIIRIDSGDVAWANSKSWLGAPQLTAQVAVRATLNREVTKAVAEDLDAWKKGAQAEPVALDLVVSKLKDRDQAAALAKHLGAPHGVREARVVVFNREYAKLSVTVESPAALKAVVDALDKDATLPLRITYETERLIHAELDFDRAHLKTTRVYWTSPPAKSAATREKAVLDGGDQLLRAALQNLPYLQVAQIQRVPDLRRLPSGEGSQEGLRLTARLAHDTKEWLVTLELLTNPKGTSLALGTGRAAEPFVAVDQAVRDLDGHYRQALDKPATRKLLGFGDDAAGTAKAEGLFVESFELGPVFPARLPRYRKEGIGTLKLKNRSAEKLTDLKARFTLGATVLSEVSVADLAPGESRSLPVPLDALPPRDTQNPFQQLAAAIAWRAGEVYGKGEAVAPLVLLHESAIDWSTPQSLAAFIDAGDKTVRELATATLAHRPQERVVGGALRDAALVFAALWHPPLTYVADPMTINFGTDLDTVQSPTETLARGAGDCDDLTVLLASLYESVGIPTAIVTVPGHVFLAVDAGVLAGGHVLYDLPDSDFIKVDGALFAPVEATAVGSSFAEAWLKGIKAVRDAHGKVEVFRTRAAWRAFPTVPRPAGGPSRLAPSNATPASWSSTDLAVRAGAKASAPWIHELSLAAVGGGAAQDALAKVPAPAEPLPATAFDWLSGRTAQAQQAAAKLCNRSVVEACYDLAVMLVLESQDDPKPDAALAATVNDALQMLPENVVAMMLDHGIGLGDEATPESAARRRMEDVLKQAREQLKARRAQGGKGPATPTIAPVAGRKGKPFDAQAAAHMFFWSRAD